MAALLPIWCTRPPWLWAVDCYLVDNPPSRLYLDPVDAGVGRTATMCVTAACLTSSKKALDEQGRPGIVVDGDTRSAEALKIGCVRICIVYSSLQQLPTAAILIQLVVHRKFEAHGFSAGPTWAPVTKRHRNLFLSVCRSNVPAGRLSEVAKTNSIPVCQDALTWHHEATVSM